MNLFERFDEIVNDEFIEKFKSYTSTAHGDLNVTVKGVFYTLLAGMIRKTNSDMSAGMLFAQIEENAAKVSLPAHLASIFSQEPVLDKIGKDGSKIISQIFPAYKSPLLSMISTYSGVSKATTTMASNIVANVIISMFQKDIENGKWDKEQMISLLRQHHEPLLNAIPEPLLEKMIPSLGLHDLLSLRPHAPKKEKSETVSREEIPAADYPDTSAPSSASYGWLIGVLIGALLIGGGYYYFYILNGDLNFFTKKEVPVESVEAIESDSTLTVEAEKVALPPDDFTAFKAYVLNPGEPAGKEFDLKSLKFVSDSVAIEAPSYAVVDSIGVLMENNPRLQLKITAFSGSGEQAFNNKRAFFVKRILTAKGINGIKIDAVSGGIGEDFAQIKVISK